MTDIISTQPISKHRQRADELTRARDAEIKVRLLRKKLFSDMEMADMPEPKFMADALLVVEIEFFESAVRRIRSIYLENDEIMGKNHSKITADALNYAMYEWDSEREDPTRYGQVFDCAIAIHELADVLEPGK